jgi:cyclophilin family peptidyl-prolyl cis-trans isomerase
LFRLLLSAGLASALLVSPTAVSTQAGKAPAGKTPPGPVLVIDTVKGVIEVELNPADAPKSVARIVELAKNGFYRGQRFHWVQPGVVQFGDPLSRDLTKRNEWGTGGSGVRNGNRPIGVAELSKKPFGRGVVGVAYRVGSKPENADSQMFILTAANPAMVGKYAQIGKVTKGLAVADKLEVQDVIKNVTVR